MTTLIEQFQRYKEKLGSNLLRGGLALEGEMKRLVARDTGNLESSISTGPLQDNGNILSVDVGSTGVFYAPIIEFGVKNRVYKYHKRKGSARPIIWIGVGQQWRERALNNTSPKILNLLKSTRR